MVFGEIIKIAISSIIYFTYVSSDVAVCEMPSELRHYWAAATCPFAESVCAFNQGRQIRTSCIAFRNYLYFALSLSLSCTERLSHTTPTALYEAQKATRRCPYWWRVCLTQHRLLCMKLRKQQEDAPIGGEVVSHSTDCSV